MHSRVPSRFIAFSVLSFCLVGAVNRCPADDLEDDFLVQGEYVGDQTGMQVVGRGDGEFDLVIYEGGLPGAGAQPAPPRRVSGDADVVANLADSMGLKKIERQSPTLNAQPPIGAVVLFDGTQASIDQHWAKGKLAEGGLLAEGATTKDVFRDYKLHVEFQTPFMPKASGQARGNSGVYHQSRYETQILDSFGLEGKDNETGGIYTVSPPAINVCYPPRSWQTYDVDFTAARFDENDKKIADARMSVRLNGVIVQSDVAVPNATRAARLPEGPTPGPIDLQDHGNPVRFRNVWIVPRDSDKEARRPIVPGFERFFAASSNPSVDGGQVLLSSLACGACHAGADSSVLPTQRGPHLSDVVSRVRTDALVAMIANPHDAKPGTTMPDPWPGLDEPARRERAVAIASYLIDQGKGHLVDRAASQDMADAGRDLYHRIGCVACHAGFDGNKTPASTSVPLGNLAKKYSLVSLARFLQNPHAVRPGLRMPALTGTTEEAFAIAAYLTGDVTIQPSAAKFQRRIYRGKWERLPDFESLDLDSSDTVTDLKIDDIQPKNNYGVVFEALLPIAFDGEYTFRLTSDDGSAFSIGENRLDNDFIHAENTVEATYKLAAGVYPIRIEYFDAGGGAALSLTMVEPSFGESKIANLISDPAHANLDFLPSKFTADKRLVEQGRNWFVSAGCKNCHAMEDDSNAIVTVATAIDGWNADRGCLAAQPAAPAVDYELNAAQRASIVAAMQSKSSATPDAVDDEKRIHMTMAGLNCYACHAHGKFGGAEISRDAVFQSTTPEMGLEGRLPPALDGVGDKLNDTYFASTIDKGANLRDYMLTRMPAFGYEELRGLHKSFNTTDRRTDVKAANNPQSHEDIVAAGRQAVGNKGLACIKCHSFGGDKGGGLGAIDMLEMTNRLRFEWFHRYLQDPTAYRPGTRMPNSFVDGKSALVDLYDGDPPLQIDAMWQYLLDGKQAKEPEGLKAGAIILAADTKPRVYRNFFTDLSARGIAVGYPNGINLIWDAEAMTLARVWRNSFIDASLHWVGRGQGRQEPLGDSVIRVEESTPIAVLSSIDDDWPTEIGRDRGYRFGGYRLDQAGNPTFAYSIGETKVTDAPMPPAGAKPMMIRKITVDRGASDESQTIVWQFATGKILPVAGGFRVDDKFTISVEGADCQIVSTGDAQSLRAVLPIGPAVSITETIRW
ncbi:Cytochrome c [Rubripirellula tenax]|uniref:Cytochrome c n=1 Tax=Rubripirellula tenax TaxID=2528015 RepID=A0A5C6FB18_9BACT|nr:family 16 glycoside hydrolase [Rubripirellula tenax]TWU56781.1 Cytochrome c [Rubripirellula tenax]